MAGRSVAVTQVNDVFFFSLLLDITTRLAIDVETFDKTLSLSLSLLGIALHCTALQSSRVNG
jgi:hypothetical protein